MAEEKAAEVPAHGPVVGGAPAVGGAPVVVGGAPIPGGAHVPVPAVIPLAAAPIPAPPVAPVAPVPIIPYGAGRVAVLYSAPPAPDLGSAPAVHVLNKSAFATSWAGLAYSMLDIPLRHGNMRLTGFTATITCSVNGKQARGDISAIADFIRKHFRLGGVIDGRRYSAGGLTRHIIHNLPGRFVIKS